MVEPINAAPEHLEEKGDRLSPKTIDPKKIFVGNLSFKVSDDMLKEYFSTCGSVEAARVSKRGRKSLGFGFVSFESEEAADKAVAQLNKTEFDSREISVEKAKETPERHRLPAHRRSSGGYQGRSFRYPSFRRRFPRRRHSGPLSKTTLFVTNLPYNCDDNVFKVIFKDHPFVDAHVVVRKSGRSTGFGFVTFASEEEQLKAFKLAQGVIVDNRAIVVKIAIEEPERDSSSSRSESEGNSPKKDIDVERISKGVENIDLKRGKKSFRNSERAHRGETAEDGSDDESPMPRRRSFRRGGSRRGRGGFFRSSQRPSRPQGPPSTTTLFVSNLPYSVDDKELSELFVSKGFVPVNTRVVVRPRTGQSKGFGFVEFADQDVQTKALAACSNLKCQERHLILKVAMDEVKELEEKEQDSVPKEEPSSPRSGEPAP